MIRPSFLSTALFFQLRSYRSWLQLFCLLCLFLGFCLKALGDSEAPVGMPPEEEPEEDPCLPGGSGDT